VSSGEFVPAQVYSPGMEVLKSTGRGALGGVWVCSLDGELLTAGAELGALIFLVCLPVGVPAGVLIGALVSQPYEKQNAFELAARNAVASAQLDPHVAQAASAYSERSGRPLTDAATADSQLEVQIARIELVATQGKNAFLRVGYDAQLVRKSDAATLGTYESEATSALHPIADWVGADGKADLLRDSLLELYEQIGEDVVDEFVLVYAGATPLVQPPFPRLLEPAGRSLERPKPTLRWQAWPWIPDAQPASTEAVVYDLRIRELGERQGNTIEAPQSTVPIYEAFGLREPAHELTEWLPLCAWFAVQVRARFPHGEVTQATEWITFAEPLDTVERIEGCELPWWVRE
jgi:hypothetical protein